DERKELLDGLKDIKKVIAQGFKEFSKGTENIKEAFESALERMPAAPVYMAAPQGVAQTAPVVQGAPVVQTVPAAPVMPVMTGMAPDATMAAPLGTLPSAGAAAYAAHKAAKTGKAAPTARPKSAAPGNASPAAKPSAQGEPMDLGETFLLTPPAKPQVRPAGMKPQSDTQPMPSVYDENGQPFHQEPPLPPQPATKTPPPPPAGDDIMKVLSDLRNKTGGDPGKTIVADNAPIPDIKSADDLEITIENFRVISSEMAKRLMFKRPSLLKETVNYDNEYNLVNASVANVGKEHVLMLILECLQESQVGEEEKLEFSLLKEGKGIWKFEAVFIDSKHIYRKGDIIFGKFKLDSARYLQAEELGIRINKSGGPVREDEKLLKIR
ncbi:MAG: hypothetical protein GY757_46740, partial [bacterium]|nr:hypothetical protein [bacterium]